MSTYDYLNYRELKKLNKTVEKIDQREEQFARLHVKNKTELNYILDSAWEHYLSESSIKIFPKTVKFQDENNSQYEFLLILDISGFFDKTNLEVREFNSFTQQWIIDFNYHDVSSEETLKLLKNLYLIDVSEYPSALNYVEKQFNTIENIDLLFPNLVSIYDFVESKGLFHGWRFGLQKHRYADLDKNLELRNWLKKEINIRTVLLKDIPSYKELEDLEFLQGLYDNMVREIDIPEKFDKLGFYPLNPIYFSEEVTAALIFPFFRKNNSRKFKAFGYPLISNETTDGYSSLIVQALRHFHDEITFESFKFQLQGSN